MGARLVSIKAKPENGGSVRPIIEQTGKGDLLCYESNSGRWFRSSEEFVKKVIDQLNKESLFDDYDTISMDELFIGLKLYLNSAYYDYGWKLNKLPFREEIFKLKLYNDGFHGMDEPVLCISSTTPAVKDYYKEEV